MKTLTENSIERSNAELNASVLNQGIENKLYTKKIKGMTEFYWGTQPITGLWMDFFSGLPMDKEKDCVRLFIKKYGKKLNEMAPGPELK